MIWYSPLSLLKVLTFCIVFRRGMYLDLLNVLLAYVYNKAHALRYLQI